MTTVTIEEMVNEKVKKEALSILNTAKELTIRKESEYINAGNLRETLKRLESEINKTFDNLIKGAYDHHRSLTAEKKRHFEPIEEARKLIKLAMINWEAEQDRIRKLEQEKIEAANRKKEEDEALRKAHEAEKSGDKEKADRILNTPIETAPVILPRTTPKIAGHTVRELWDGEVFDILQLVKDIAEGKASLKL